MVDIYYPTVGKRCVYFKSSSLTNSAVDSIALTAYPAVVIEQTQPRLGPGDIYDEAGKNELKVGTVVTVYFQTGDWVFAEFNGYLGLTRGWLKTESVVSK